MARGIIMIIPPSIWIPAATSLVGGFIKRQQYRMDREYMHPANQVRRAAEAGLPLAALSEVQQFNQPGPDPGIGEAGAHIGRYSQVQKELQKVENQKEDKRIKKAEADLAEGKRNYLLGQKGTDTANTNLSGQMKTLYGIDQATERGKRFEANIKDVEAGNIRTKTILENNKMLAEIGNIYKEGRMKEEQITGQQLANKVTAIVARYQPRINEANLKKIGAEIAKLGVETDIAKVHRTVTQETEGLTISQAYQEFYKKKIETDAVRQLFETQTDYNRFRKEADKLFRADASNFNPAKLSERLLALFKTIVADVSGQSSKLLQILK